MNTKIIVLAFFCFSQLEIDFTKFDFFSLNFLLRFGNISITAIVHLQKLEVGFSKFGLGISNLLGCLDNLNITPLGVNDG